MDAADGGARSTKGQLQRANPALGWTAGCRHLHRGQRCGRRARCPNPAPSGERGGWSQLWHMRPTCPLCHWWEARHCRCTLQRVLHTGGQRAKQRPRRLGVRCHLCAEGRSIPRSGHRHNIHRIEQLGEVDPLWMIIGERRQRRRGRDQHGRDDQQRARDDRKLAASAVHGRGQWQHQGHAQQAYQQRHAGGRRPVLASGRQARHRRGKQVQAQHSWHGRSGDGVDDPMVAQHDSQEAVVMRIEHCIDMFLASLLQ
mmetsp:Transcript_22013/g.70860  ORF Transcript_22013/g.70860 Transcript_22013/m.70860 type:complete len:256 (+) Transcript_22013:377-1144(+)